MTDDVILKAVSDQLLRYCRIGFATLLIWFAVQSVTLAPAGLSPLTLLLGWLFYSLPLLFFIPGLRSGTARSQVWLAFVLLFYGVLSLTRSFAPGLAGLMSMIESVLIIGLFTLAIRYVKAKRATQGGAL